MPSYTMGLSETNNKRKCDLSQLSEEKYLEWKEDDVCI